LHVHLIRYQWQSEEKFEDLEKKIFSFWFFTRKRSRKESRSFVAVRASRIAENKNE
jgi:hypothetical protein